ncbi:Uncharacterised protein [Zhongshania aliphaticivorans]|uniref:Polysaccharide chain length determinant N-terminal domain-containing protein n=1 Tax=Zhongshania aliphaticivorans TaxID=1470434 RepID=A0A5S9Q7E1_9GAMM|nr:hypothetical protein [Zhongshania aliphaticivorans]CAA0086983.1 Uncharacterised protein [Zhongshania aliphaticivorans]CAA0113853.1 Uncharacterised protein [Zhongshania aliphaticivorans]
MTQGVDPQREIQLYKEAADKPRWTRYLIVGVISLVLIWGLVGLYISSAPEYVSNFAFVLPGKSGSSKVNLESIGEASSSSTSPFGTKGINPRVNYKEMLLSATVIGAASKSLDIEYADFKKPVIKLVDETAIIQVSTKAYSPEFAQQQAAALIESFNDRIAMLRMDELASREEAVSQALSVYKTRLEEAQLELIDHKQRSQYVSARQYEELSLRLERIKEDRVSSIAERDRVSGYVDQLSRNLGITPQLAASAFILNADQQFRENLENYQNATATLAVYRSKWGDAHPQVVQEQARQNGTLSALQKRSFELVGHKDMSTIKLINMNDSSEQGSLFQDLLVSFAQIEGLIGKLKQLDIAIADHKNNLKLFAEEAAKLEELERNYQIAEAVYTSAVTQIDTSKTDIFASYPLVQVLAAPSLPQRPASPNKILAIVGGVLGSGMALFGLFLLWKRKQLIQKILSKSGFGTL